MQKSPEKTDYLFVDSFLCRHTHKDSQSTEKVKIRETSGRMLQIRVEGSPYQSILCSTKNATPQLVHKNNFNSSCMRINFGYVLHAFAVFFKLQILHEGSLAWPWKDNNLYTANAI